MLGFVVFFSFVKTFSCEYKSSNRKSKKSCQRKPENVRKILDSLTVFGLLHLSVQSLQMRSIHSEHNAQSITELFDLWCASLFLTSLVLALSVTSVIPAAFAMSACFIVLPSVCDRI